MSIYYEEHGHRNAQDAIWGDIRVYRNDDTLHWHENIEVIHVFEGECKIINGAEIIELWPGDTCVVNSKEIHALRCSEAPCKNAYFILSEKFCAELGFFTNSVVFPKKVSDERLSQIFLRIVNEHLQKNDYFESSIKILLLSALLILFRDYATERGESVSSAKSALTKKIMEYIRENYRNEITMEMLEKHCTYSRYYISRVFKEVSGDSVMGYLNEVRVSAAKLMLESTAKPIGEIATETGFESQSYFGKVFKRIVGMSPLEYRNEKKIMSE